MNHAAPAAKPDDALRACRNALKTTPDHGEALLHIYQVCSELGQQTGGKQIEKLIKALPKNVGLKRVAARLYQDWQEYTKQYATLDKLYRQGIRSESFYDDYARSLKNTGKPEQCLAIAGEALQQFPDSLELLKLRANARFWLGHHQEALTDGETILKAEPDNHHVRTTVGSLKLMLSGCSDGFEDYTAHRDVEIARSGLHIAPHLPEWKGEEPQGKHLLLWTSQGIGDVIMFASLIPWLQSKGCNITLAVYEKAVPLFTRSFPDIRVVTFTKELLAQPNGGFDYHAPLGNLMQYTLPHYTPAERGAYMKAAPELTENLRKKYQQQAPGKKLVGISWHTTNPDTFAQRNIPLADWKPLLARDDVQVISLQYGDHRQEINAVNRKHPGSILLDDSVDAFGNTDALAAQIAAMDAVISIQNSTVHLAGGLSVPCTLLLSAASEWRWGVSGNTNRWYKSVKVVRQKELLKWGPALRAACERL